MFTSKLPASLQGAPKKMCGNLSDCYKQNAIEEQSCRAGWWFGIKSKQSPKTKQKDKNVCRQSWTDVKNRSTKPNGVLAEVPGNQQKATQGMEELSPSGSRWGSDGIRPLWGSWSRKRPTHAHILMQFINPKDKRHHKRHQPGTETAYHQLWILENNGAGLQSIDIGLFAAPPSRPTLGSASGSDLEPSCFYVINSLDVIIPAPGL